MHTERGNVLVVLIVIFVLLFIAGFFQNGTFFSHSFNYRSILRLPCGLTLKTPSDGDAVTFPLQIRGYANLCGWEAKDGIAGTVQAFDEDGTVMTAAIPLTVSAGETDPPAYFNIELSVEHPPHTAKGRLLFVSTTGLIHVVPVSFVAEH